MNYPNLSKAIWALGAAIALVSCSSDYEPSEPSITPTSTRAVADVAHTFTIQQAQLIANTKLKKSAISAQGANIKPIMAQNEVNVATLLSDTVAYVINYKNNEGFAIIANDNRIDPILAYSNKGNFSDENIMAKAFFLDKIEGYLASLDENGVLSTQTNNTENAPVRRIIVEPQITIELSPTDPFNKQVNKEHPGCHAGFVNVAAANIISHTLKQLTYHNFFYDFESINYALNKGYGFNPVNPGLINPLGFIETKYPRQFLYSYDGSISAYNQLLYDLGKDDGTIYHYQESYGSDYGVTTTLPWSVIPVLENMGLTLTEKTSDHDINNIVTLLFDGYLVNMSGTIIKNDGGGYPDNNLFRGPIAWVIDGCNVTLDNNNKVKSGELHIVWGLFDLGNGYFSYPILTMEDQHHLNLLYHFGVKSNE